MSEKWEEVYTEDQIKKIQQLELVNLAELSRVCKIIGVEFFLYGGSLLGAVRHKGFVPWDDDLDIAMMRDDYIRFIHNAPKLLKDNFYLQTPYTDRKSPYFYTKLRLKGTKCIEYSHHQLDMEKGIYIDIYPIDQLPENEVTFLRRYRKFQKIVRHFYLRQTPYRGSPPKGLKDKVKSLLRVFISLMLKLVPHDVYLKKLDKISTSFNGQDTHIYGNYSYPKPVNIFDSIKPFEKGIFENIDVNLPRDWEQHLERRYGNYMQLPPKEERIGHKPYVLDFGNYFKD